MQSRILYEDTDIIVLRKPAGLAVQTAGLGQPDMVSELKNYLRRERNGGSMTAGQREPYLGIIHRLDQPVEGIVVFAKTKTAAASLTGWLRLQGDESVFAKRYYAVLCGIPAALEGRLTDYLSKQAVKNGKRTEYRSIVIEPEAKKESCFESRNCPEGREHSVGSEGRGNPLRAVLEYRILQVREERGLALADIRIHTGRFHQIRAQMAHAGTPLLGDLKYGGQETRALARTLGVRNVALCAYWVEFAHPVSKERMSFRIVPENPAFSSFSQL